jgi:hypothetical protein
MGDSPIERLRRGTLPRMVDWYDPRLLARIGIREMVSHTLGQYADQRLLQATSDRVRDESELVARYDYSVTDPKQRAFDPRRTVKTDAEGGVWVDYIADLGDGFEPTYAMAYLMAADALEIDGADRPLEAGQILVLGGDQAYPQATRQEYQERFINPYDWAFTTDRPQRRMFAIPGNHDWYDGLNAFDGVFCSARDRISGGLGKQIGGWRCVQHRSYWAIKLPYNWWIWGADIQLGGDLDDAQRDYFDAVSDGMSAEDKVIICLAEPSWLRQQYDNLHQINILASKSGAKVCAVLAGDWHHYSRYHSPDPGVHLITCGGGGAFAHATHSLKSKLKLQWAKKTASKTRVTSSTDTQAFDQIERRVLQEPEEGDFTEQTYEVTAGDATPAGEGATAPKPGGETSRQTDTMQSAMDEALQRAREKLESAKRILGPIATDLYDYRSPRIYPSRGTSRLLSLRNVFFPFQHWRFALAIGVIYLIFYWMAQNVNDTLGYFGWFANELQAGQTVPDYAEAVITDETGKTIYYTITKDGRTGIERVLWFVFLASQRSIMFFVFVIGLWALLINYVESPFQRGWSRGLFRFSVGTIHFLAHLLAIGLLGVAISLITGGLGFLGAKVWQIASEISSGLARSEDDVRAVAGLFGPLLMVPFGALVGGIVWGAYWAITCSLFSMHTGDAFGALAIKDYKSFLRMRFEKDKVTIYPIGLDRVPGPLGWREPRPADTGLTHNPQIVPVRPLKPHLIEEPIVIRPEDIRT